MAPEIWIYAACADSPQKQSHALLETALKRWSIEQGLGETDLCVVRPQYKKPYLKALPHIGVSVSRSGERWVCAVSEQPLGIDLQQENFSGTERIARRFFHPAEQAFLAERPDAFFSVWTAKESYVKFTGEGVTDQFGDFSVVENGMLRRKIGEAQLQLLPFESGYILCLCGKDVSDVHIAWL